MEDKISELEQALLEPGIASDFMKLNELTQEKEAIEKQLDDKMERYVYLEELAEQIANQ